MPLDAELFTKINGQMDPVAFKQKIGALDPEGKNINPLNNKPFSEQYRFTAETGDTAKISEMTQSEMINKLRKKGRLGSKSGWRYGKVYTQQDLFFRKILNNQVMLVKAGTGVGKTVAIPKLIAHYFGYKKKFYVTIPTVKVARSAAEYDATCMDVALGEEIGYNAGGINLTDRNLTKIVYCTNKVVQNKLQNPDDPMFEECSALIIDEVHQRRIDQDITLLLACKLIKKRPDFKLIVMSATIDPKPFMDFFANQNLLHTLYEPIGATGSNFKVEDIFATKQIKPNEAYGTELVNKLDELLQTTTKCHIIAFIPTNPSAYKVKNEIEKRIAANPGQYPEKPWVVIFTGGTKEADTEFIQSEEPVSSKYPGKSRKLIIATNVAEFGLTIPTDKAGYDLRYVVDSGYSFNKDFDADIYGYVMETRLVAKANIAQRCGRTGRKGDGFCIRMYSEEDFNNLDQYPSPDIEKEDYTDEFIGFLDTPSIGGLLPALKFTYELLTPPTRSNVKNAVKNLESHNLVIKRDSNYLVSPMCKIMNRLSKYGYKNAKMIISSYYWGCLNQCIYLTAIIFSCNKGFEDMFLVPDKRFARDEYIKFISKIKKFMHQSGEHLTMFNIYNQTRQKDFFQVDDDDPEYINKLSKYRRKLCEGMNIVYSKMENIDGEIRELEKNVMDVLPEIAKLNLFNVAGFTSHEKYLKLLEKEEKLAKIEALDAGGIIEPYQSIINKSNLQNNLQNKKTKKKNLLINTGGTLKANKFKKKFEHDRNMKKKKWQKEEEEEEKEIHKIVGNSKSDLVRKLNKVTLFGVSEMNVVRFKDVANNMLASLFFGYYNNIAYFIDYKVGKGKKGNNKNYLVKHIDSNMPFQMASIKDSIFDDDKLAKRPPLVIYNQFMSNPIFGNSLKLLSKIPPTILNKYGIL
jgi:HrpA-like RNA helicase